MKTYRLKKGLVAGRLIDMSLEGKIVAPVSMSLLKKDNLMVIWDKQFIIINQDDKPLLIRTFADKWGRNKNYKLGYWEWKPVK